MMAPPRTASSEGVVLIPATTKNSTTGYKGVSFHRSKKQFVARARDGGKDVSLGYFDTAEEAATAYARSEYGHADAAKLPIVISPAMDMPNPQNEYAPPYALVSGA